MSFLKELKRRNVVRVAIAYVVAAWVLAQAADLVLDVMGAPDMVLRSLVALLALGFLPAVIFAWAFEMTPEGIRRESEIEPGRSITGVTARKLDFITIGLLITAIVLVAADRFLPLQEGVGSGEPAASATLVQSENTPTEADSPSEAEGVSEKSIAVLPFANRSNRDDDLFFTDGIHDDLLTQLAKIRDLKVISRTSVMEYRDTSKKLREIGRELGVATILEGGIQKVGDRVRINAQLIEVSTDRHLWAETYDRELTAENIFELQSEITREIVSAISIELTPDEERSLMETPTQSLAAYEAYLQGRKLIYSANYSREEEELARPWFEKALEHDPEYVEAIALLAQLYGQLYWRGIDTSEELLKTYRESVDLALALNPRSPASLRASANWDYRVENNYQSSERLLKRALESLPGNADLHGDLGLTQRRLGQWEQSVGSFQRALELDPANRFYRALMVETMEAYDNWQGILVNTVSIEDADPSELDIQLNRARAQFNLTGELAPFEKVFQTMTLTFTSTYAFYSPMQYWYQRDWDGVIEVLNSPLWMQTDNEDFPIRSRHLQLGLAWRFKGDEARATEHLEAAIADPEPVMASALQPLGYGGMTIALSLAALGHFEEALFLAQKLTGEIPHERDALLFGWLLTRQAMIKGMSGDLDGAVEDLRAALETPTAFKTTSWDLHYNPAWDFMRDDTRFQQLATPDNLIRATRPEASGT